MSWLPKKLDAWLCRQGKGCRLRSSQRRTVRRSRLEGFESRRLLASVPFGATPQDTAEFMLGEVLVTVVLMESDGSIDPSSEDWTDLEKTRVKERVLAGMNWWEELLDAQGSVHDLNFHFDWTYTDQPVMTGYEPISRPSDDFARWIDDFFAAADVPNVGSFSERIRVFNDVQRRVFGTHWAFTIFVVDAASDTDKRFALGGSFQQAFAYAGGRFFVTTAERPASTYAHETGHMFWAMDEYAGGRPFTARRGYYNSQNTNGADGNPDPASRVWSIMDSHEIAFEARAISASAREMIGWRDTDQDGIFDVLDVPSVLAGATQFDAETRLASFTGVAQVSALENLNTSGTSNDMTINQIDVLQIRWDQGDWRTVAEYHAYQATIEVAAPVPVGVREIEWRALDVASGVASNVFRLEVDPGQARWQNLANPWDVNGDGFVSPLDALLVINRLNLEGAGELTGPAQGAPYLDANGDGFLSPLDALLVINRLNQLNVAGGGGAAAEGERPTAWRIAAAIDPDAGDGKLTEENAWVASDPLSCGLKEESLTGGTCASA